MLNLNERQKHFCQEYLKDFNGTRAYREVYKVQNDRTAASNAFRMLRNADIQAYLRELIKDRSDRTGIRNDDIVNKLWEIVNRCLQKVRPVQRWEGQNLVTEYAFNAMAAIRALELLGKHLGIYNSKAEDSEVRHIVEIKNLAFMPEEEVQQYIQQMNKGAFEDGVFIKSDS